MLIRICVSLALFSFAAYGIGASARESFNLAQQAVEILGGVLLLAGLWTPAAGVLVAINETSIGLSASSARHEELWSHVFLAGISLSVAMLGPGAWSVDARLFGRKRIDIDRSRGKRSSH